MLYKRKLPDGSRTAVWYYDFVIRGRRHKGCTGIHDKALAQDFEDELKAEVRLGRPLDATQRPPLPTFEEYAKSYREGDGALKASGDDDQSILDRALVPFFGKRHLDAIERADVERFRNDRLAGKLYLEDRNRIKEPKPATVGRELSLLKRILNIAVEAGLLDRNPAARVKMPKVSNRRERVIDDEEYARLLLAVAPRARRRPGVHEGAHLRPMMILAYETGMREGEILAMRWADVNLKQHFVHLPKTKNGEAREVPLSEKAEKALREWGRGNDTYVFPALSGEGTLCNVSHAFRRLAERAKVQDVRFHDFRHTFCTRKVEEGFDLITLKSITGHKTLAMLDRYTHPSPARKLAVVRPAGVPPMSPHKVATG